MIIYSLFDGSVVMGIDKYKDLQKSAEKLPNYFKGNLDLTGKLRSISHNISDRAFIRLLENTLFVPFQFFAVEIEKNHFI